MFYKDWKLGNVVTDKILYSYFQIKVQWWKVMKNVIFFMPTLLEISNMPY